MNETEIRTLEIEASGQKNTTFSCTMLFSKEIKSGTPPFKHWVHCNITLYIWTGVYSLDYTDQWLTCVVSLKHNYSKPVVMVEVKLTNQN